MNRLTSHEGVKTKIAKTHDTSKTAATRKHVLSSYEEIVESELRHKRMKSRKHTGGKRRGEITFNDDGPIAKVPRLLGPILSERFRSSSSSGVNHA